MMNREGDGLGMRLSEICQDDSRLRSHQLSHSNALWNKTPRVLQKKVQCQTIKILRVSSV
jgi:hypothetical protein